MKSCKVKQGTRSRWLDGHRLCPRCNRLKPKETFDHHRCEDCVRRAKQDHYNRLSAEARLWRAARARARKRGIPFDLLLEDIVIPPVCPVLGLPMDRPSLDRFDPTRGYTPDNIRVISTRANTLKSDGTVAELELVLAYMRRGAGL